MPEENNNLEPRRRISFGFIFSILLVVGLVGILIWRIFGNSNKYTDITRQQFVQVLMNDRVESVNVTHYAGSTNVVVTGVYKESDDTKKVAYSVTMDEATYTTEMDYDYKYDGDPNVTHTVTGSFAEILAEHYTKPINYFCVEGYSSTVDSSE